MKRNGMLSAALFLGAVSIAPAGLAAQDVMLGVKGGINIADVDVEDDEAFESDTRTGLVGGLFAQLGLGDMFAIRPEGLYSQKGFSQEEAGQELTLKADYIEVPVLFAARFSQGSVRPVLFAGPVIGFEASCKIEDATTEESIDCEDAEVETESTDFGATFGAGVELDAGGFVVLFDGRYTLGLSDIDAMDASEAKNRVWSFMAGIGFQP